MSTYEQITQHNYITLFTYEQMCIVKIQGTPGFEPGTCRSVVNLQSHALPLSYIPTNMVTNNNIIIETCLLMNKCSLLKYWGHRGLN